ncbi:MAG: hypothetical protein IJF83_00125 [Methanobrevibacter sp.]|nr:hypothetical protein [Methanobrevibacter sp.]
MVQKVMIKDEINSSLEMNTAADDFLNKVNEIEDDEILIDFTGIVFISRSFAQAYFSKKNKLGKNIDEINVPDEVKPLLDLIKKKFEK